MGILDKFRGAFAGQRAGKPLDISKRFVMNRHAFHGTMSRFHVVKDIHTGELFGIKLLDEQKTKLFRERFRGLNAAHRRRDRDADSPSTDCPDIRIRKDDQRAGIHPDGVDRWSRPECSDQKPQRGTAGEPIEIDPGHGRGAYRPFTMPALSTEISAREISSATGTCRRSS